MRVPKPYANIKTLKGTGRKPLVKGMEHTPQDSIESRRAELHQQAAGVR